MFDDQIGDPLPLQEPGEEGDLLKRFLEESGVDEGLSAIERLENPEASSQLIDEETTVPDRIDLRSESSLPRVSPLPAFPGSTSSEGSNSTGNDQIDREITDPEEMFDASRKALLEQ